MNTQLMKSIPGPSRGRFGVGNYASLLLASAMACSFNSARAIIPEPDNIIYGTIAIAGAPVLAAQTNFIVEARRTTNGPAIASYRMGSDASVGNFYLLKLKLESIPPINDADASENGDTLLIILRDASGIRGATNFTIVERGEVQRMDFGQRVRDSDGDGIPDDWELKFYGNLLPVPGTVGSNQMTVVQHFIAGTDPRDPNAGFRLFIAKTNGLKRVWFIAGAAEGPGYEGMIRHYTLQYRPNLGSGFWTDVPNYIDIAGTNQTVNYYTANEPIGFYRGCIRLEGFDVPVSTVDTDGDGLPDAWEVIYFGNLTRNGTYIGPNGRPASQNYVAGTDPNNINSQFRLTITRSNNQQWVSFFGLKAQGAGYEGKTRFYALEASTSVTGTYLGVPSFTNLIGNDQAIVYPVPISNPQQQFFRGRVWLQGP